MTQYNSINIKLFKLQLKKLKSGIKTGTEVNLNLASNVIRNSNEKSNFLIILIIITRWISFKALKNFCN